MSEKIVRLDKSVIDMVYPVGAIYMSVNSTNPGNLFGGKWEQIKDRFLLAAGDNYAAGSTGGEAQHKLTVDEMPSHTHNTYIDKTCCAYVTGDHSVWKQSLVNKDDHSYNKEYYFAFSGGDQPHNNMPPYLSVYMWKRTA